MNYQETECMVCASVLSEPHGKPGPNVCTALAHWPYFESPEACKVAEAVVKCSHRGWRTTRNNVGRLIADEYKPWVFLHPLFGDRQALPLSCAESAAMTLLPLYRNKRIVEMIGRAYEKCMAKPESARQVAIDLHIQLGDWV